VTLYTVGHGTRTVEELAEVARSAGVERIVDVRRHPGSRRWPHLGRTNLEAALPELGIDYDWAGEALGGRRSVQPDSPHVAWRNASFRGYADHMGTAQFRAALRELLVEDNPVSAVMCSETVWWRCHRRLIADAATMLGMPVVHLLSVKDHPVHPLHPEARPGEDGWPVYDAGQEPLL
jgi:uncharacterized protein (DUF488 family)